MLFRFPTARQRTLRLHALRHRPAPRLTLEPLETRTLLATFTVTASADSGVGSLRNAIESANASQGPDLIVFDIAGTPGAVRTINLGSALPDITDTLNIDASTQPDFQNAPLIELNGAQAGSFEDGLVFAAPNSSLRGLVINRFAGNGIVINADNVAIRQSYIGLNNAGTVDLGNGANGILVNDADDVTIGGSNFSDRVVIAGNQGAGISISGEAVNGANILNSFFGLSAAGTTPISSNLGLVVANTQNLFVRGNAFGGSASWAITIVDTTGAIISGNTIGLDILADAPVSNFSGILIGQSTNIVIGGALASDRNIISANQGDAIDVVESSSVSILGNYLGTAANGITPRGNGGGITLIDASNILVRDNIIAHANFGILVAETEGSALNNVFRRNAIYDITAATIDLGGDGINFNDNDDADTGPNGFQNSPVLSDVKISGSTVTFTGALHSKPDTTYTLDLFLSPGPDLGRFAESVPPGVTPTGLPFGGGEGRFYIGSIDVTTDAGGNASFNQVFTNISVPSNAEGSATATGPEGTSEFSSAFDVGEGDLAIVANNLQATQGVPLTDVVVATISDPLGGSVSDEFLVTIDWGDGATTELDEAIDIGDGLFQVRASHTYASSGNFVITVSVEHLDERTASDTANISVAPSTIVGNGRDISSAPGQSFTNRILATFVDAVSNSVPADFTVTIDWGDKSNSSSGTLTKNSSGVFVVRGSHTYGSSGEYNIQITIEHDSGRTITASGTAIVDETSIEPTALRFAAVAGLRTGLVRSALFEDPVAGNNEPLASYSSTINWGNGRSSAGIIERRRDGLLVVRGRITFREAGTYPISVSLSHKDGRSSQAASEARVLPAPIVPLLTVPITLAGSQFNGRLVSFLDANPFHTASDYSASIRWKDAGPSFARVRSAGDGLFHITAAHTFSAPGIYRVRIDLLAPDGQVHSFNKRIRVRM